MSEQELATVTGYSIEFELILGAFNTTNLKNKDFKFRLDRHL